MSNKSLLDTHADAILTPTKQPMVHAIRLNPPPKNNDKPGPLLREDKTLIKGTYPGRIQEPNVSNTLTKSTSPYADSDYWLGDPALKHGSVSLPLSTTETLVCTLTERPYPLVLHLYLDVLVDPKAPCLTGMWVEESRI
jgi:hypothetical protein